MSTPFDLLYDRLLLDIKEDVTLGALKAKNIVEFKTRENREKPAHQAADLPELQLIMTDIRGNLQASSSHSELTTAWRFMAVTGTHDSKKVHSLLFAVIRVLTRYKLNLANVQWKNRKLVKDVRLVRGDQGKVNENTTNIAGFATIVDVEIDISFKTSDLIEND